MFKRKRECKKLKGMLSPYIDGQLSPSEMERIERHIEECDACRRELESLRAVVSLLHRVPVVAPRRSFTIAARAPRRYPAALGALRVATAVAVLMLAFVITGDALHFFESGRVEDRSTLQEDTPVPTAMDGEGFDTEAETPEAEGYGWPSEGTPAPAAPGGEGLDTKQEPSETWGYAWPVRYVELALVGVVVVLGGTTVIFWQKRRIGSEKTLKS